MRARRLRRAAVALGLALALASAAAGQKVLRYAFPLPESGFDPAQITDLYSRTVAAGIFEAPLEYEYLAQPARLRPATAAALPEVSADHRRFVFRLRPGIFFAEHPAFGGRRRELVAEDYVYALKRHYDPRWKSGNLQQLESAGVLGLSELRQRALAERRPFDYDTPVQGLRSLDRYRFELRLARPDPRFVHLFADPSFAGAVAREVVEAEGRDIGAHPVGTGPWRLVEWRRGLRIVLEHRPDWHGQHYAETAPADAPAALRAQADRWRGRSLPMLDRVEIAVIEQPQPRWLAFLNGEHDLIENLAGDFAAQALPGGRLAPHLAARGLQAWRSPLPSIAMTYFAMEDPVVGGYGAARVALRRAIALAVDVERERLLVRGGQALPANGLIAPLTYGHDAALRSEMGTHDLARARALLDLYGYVDHDGDGWREAPDGRPLRLRYAMQSDATSRALAEQWQRNMAALGLRIEFEIATWAENLKRSRAGRLMMWGVGWMASEPDGDTFLALGYGPNAGQGNPSGFALPAFDRLYEHQRSLPDGPQRLAAMQAAQRLLLTYMPMKVHVHQLATDLAQPALQGYRRNPFVPNFWKYVDLER
ncbi:bicyclomycin resistance protein [Rubrivivax gelatinosus]|uniref:ABC transporter substrate-binding protein n=1 Tax=Rubrivivax gelatinosus TaxID=28068 RepID=UPI001903A1E8|nr:ABC transporter substrate-binding protein [Rubrivivax gelatinosus]MBK1615840.1 bicyclomycin resistance protein [Rubrivivax gelatinosus]